MAQIKRNNRQLPANIPLYFDDVATRDSWKMAQQAPFQIAPMPAVSVYETTDEFIIELAVPGISHEDLTIQMTEKGLWVEYAPPTDRFEPMDERRTWRKEYRQAGFQRGFELSTDVLDFDGMQVSSANGLIQFIFPKHNPFRGRVMQAMPFSDN